MRKTVLYLSLAKYIYSVLYIKRRRLCEQCLKFSAKSCTSFAEENVLADSTNYN